MNIPINKIIWIVITSGFYTLSLNVTGQVRFRPRVYFGVGLRRAVNTDVPPLKIEDELDQLYYDWNLAFPKRNFFHAQTRLDLFEFWNFSIGYVFWGHHYEYSVYFPEGLVKVNKAYPHSYDYSLHGVSFQWNAANKLLSLKWIVPFVIGGVGRFFGSYKDFRYEFLDTEIGQDEVITLVVSHAEEYKGWGVLFGVGAVVFKYAYFYVGFVDFRQSVLPTRGFVDFVVGATF